MTNAILHPVNTKETYLLNIGLNVGKIEPKGQFKKTLKVCNIDSCLFIKNGQYVANGETINKRTAVIRLDIDPGQLQYFIPYLCEQLKQDMIPVYNIREQSGKMFYRSGYNGELLQFDSDYFIFS